METPKRFVDEVNKIVLDFIWGHKPPKIKYTTFIKTRQEGGLDMKDFALFNKALKLKDFGLLQDFSVPSLKILAYFKILAFQNPEFKSWDDFNILAYLNILAFQNPKFKIIADFNFFAFQNLELKILANFRVLAFQNPEFKISADFKILAFQNPQFKIFAFQNR